MEESLKKTKAKSLLTNGISVLLVLVCLALFTGIARKAAWSYDMTAQKLFTLSAGSEEVINAVDGKVTILAVYPKGREEMMVKSLLDEYQKNSQKVAVEYIDPEREPAKLASYNLDMAVVPNGSIIVQSGGKSKVLQSSMLFGNTAEGKVFYGEREISGAIRYVTAVDLPVAYVVQGHGETDPATMTGALSALELETYELRTLNLVTTGEVPKDASVLVISSPKEDITKEEASYLADYLKTGKGLLLMVDSVLNSNSVQLNNLNDLCNTFGVDITNNYVVEESAKHYLSSSKMHLIPSMAYHQITKPIAEEQKLIVLPVVRGLGSVPFDETTVELNPLLISSENSWARVDVTQQSAELSAGDVAGPIPLAYTAVISNAKWGAEPSRVAVIGNASFSYDGNIEVQANRDLWLNTVNWLGGEGSALSIAPKIIDGNRMVIRGQDFGVLAVLCIVVLPAIPFGIGLFVWLRRKNR